MKLGFLPKAEPAIQKTLLLSAALCLFIGASSAAATVPALTVASISAKAGSRVNLPINFDPKTLSVAGLQFAVSLPKGLSVSKVTAGDIVGVADKSVSTSLKGDVYNVLVFGLNQKTLGAGNLVTLQLKVASNTKKGTLDLPISKVIYSDASGNTVNGTLIPGKVIVK